MESVDKEGTAGDSKHQAVYRDSTDMTLALVFMCLQHD